MQASTQQSIERARARVLADVLICHPGRLARLAFHSWPTAASLHWSTARILAKSPSCPTCASLFGQPHPANTPSHWPARPLAATTRLAPSMHGRLRRSRALPCSCSGWGLDWSHNPRLTPPPHRLTLVEYAVALDSAGSRGGPKHTSSWVGLGIGASLEASREPRL